MKFTFARIPEICFGSGNITVLPQKILKFGKRVLIITGASSFRSSGSYMTLTNALKKENITYYEESVIGEPSPSFVDEISAKYRKMDIEVVVAIGGGSTTDAGKAISAMLPQEDSVIAYLEGMETKKHNGIKIPFIAVPTSAGTGSEATKNAVLSEIGERGFKKSLRHDQFVPDIALVDPKLTLSSPPHITAACGLDALTQLLEAYVSTNASSMTDALAFSGLEHFKAGFLSAFHSGSEDLLARENMCYASLLSGIVLANAGLGVVHGFASPIGGHFSIPHGVVCGTLLPISTEVTLQGLLKDEEKNKTVLEKYAKAGDLLSGTHSATIKESCESLIHTLKEYVRITNLPKLGAYGITHCHVSKIVEETSNKNNPIQLTKEQLAFILESSL